MKLCPVVPEICRGQVHASRKERIRIIIIKIKNKNKNNNKKRSKNNKSPKLCLGDLNIHGKALPEALFILYIAELSPSTTIHWLSNLSDISLEWVVHFGRNMSDLRVWSLNHLECTVFSLPEPTWIVCLVFKQYSFHKEGLAPWFSRYGLSIVVLWIYT